MPLTILEKFTHAPITKTNAYCLLVLLPNREVQTRGGIIAREVPQHWERVTSNGCVVRCHSEVEAQEAAMFLGNGIQEGQWLNVAYEAYMPRRDDLPYHDWIKGMRGERLERLGVREDALPESQDPALGRMSDNEWLRGGPR